MSDGQFFPNKKNKIEQNIDPINTGRIAIRQSNWVVIQAINGTKISCPAANPEVKIPTTNPLFSLNLLVATVAERPNPRIPEDIPRQTPIPKNKCHFWDTNTVIKRPRTESIQEIITTFDIPSFNINAPPKGARHAKTKSIIAIAEEISEIFQFNAFIIGSIRTWGALIAAEENTDVRKVITIITHP